MNKKLHLCLTKIPHPYEIINKYGYKTLQSIGPAHAAFAKDIKWTDKKNIKVGFLRKKFVYNGEYLNPNFSIDKAKWVKSTIEKYFINNGMVNLSFEWDVPLDESDIRICFIQELGAWSVLGTNALSITKDQPTMNLGWLDNYDDYDFPAAAGTSAVVIHEFGHAIGLIHEHSRSDAPLNWNKQAVYDSLGAPPNSWSPEECDQQIFNPQDFDTHNSSKYDPLSIMHYYFPNEYFNDPKPNLQHVTKLSQIDINTISNRYPGGGGKSIGEISDTGGDNGYSDSWLNNNWYWILITVIIIILLIVILKK